MKKILSIILLVVFCTVVTNAQTATNKIDSTGHVGIGTVSPLAKFSIYNTGIFNTQEGFTGQDHILLSGINPGIGNYFGGITWKSGSRRRASIAAVMEHSDSDYVGLAFFTQGVDGPGPMYESMRINRRGYLGINTTTPTTMLEVFTSSQNAASGIDLSQGNDSNNRNSGRLFFSNKGELNNSFSLLKTGDSFSIRSNATPNASSGTARLIIRNNGNVGIGLLPERPLHIISSTEHHQIRIEGSEGKHTWMQFYPDGTNVNNWQIGSNTYGYSIYDITNSSYRFTVSNSGNIGIGTKNPDQKLTVKGKIHSEEVIVDLNVPGPDYVFEEDYALPSLSEIEAFIKANKHLPEVPSAKEIEENGIVLGEMNMLLLKKMEEMTLYMIHAQKEIESLKKTNAALVEKMERLERSN